MSVADAIAERGQLVANYHPHPRAAELDQRNWLSEVVYFLLPDRFNAGPTELDLGSLDADLNRCDLWAISGRNRFQGGTIHGIIDKLPYLEQLGITALWVAPVWQQRAAGLNRSMGGATGYTDDKYPAGLPATFGDEAKVRDLLGPSDDYHGYAIQHFLNVDPRFGTAADLCALVAAAHDLGIRVILDIIINHSGEVWLYDSCPLDTLRPPYLPDEGQDGYRPAVGSRYPFGQFLDSDNRPMASPVTRDDIFSAVWPEELQDPDAYHRRGFGDYGLPDNFHDNDDEIRDADWFNRDFRYDVSLAPGQLDEHGRPPLIESMIGIWTYWLAMTDCDGFRVDTLKHVPPPTAAQFCQQVRAFAEAQLDKPDFLIVGEVGGSDAEAAQYLELDPDPYLRVLEVGERRYQLRQVAGGDQDAPTADYVLTPTLPNVDSSRLRDRVMTSIDDHDGLGTGAPLRFAARYFPEAVPRAVALLLFGPGIPCLYYGTEQALHGPDQANLPYLGSGDYGLGNYGQGGDRYLREAMFAPVHPRKAGKAGMLSGANGIEWDLPGFTPGGPGTSSRFEDSDTFQAIRTLLAARKDHDQLWRGAIEVCPVGTSGAAFENNPGAPVIAWTRSYRNDAGSRQSALIVLNRRGVGSGAWHCAVQLPASFTVHASLSLLCAVAGNAAGASQQLPVHPGAQADQPWIELDIDGCGVQVFGAVDSG